MKTLRPPDPDASGPILVLDAGARVCRVGVLRDGRWLALATSEEPVLESLFALTREAMGEGCLELEDLVAFAYCSGPGSVLGLRLSAMALLTWQKLLSHPLHVFHYHSLELSRRHLLKEVQYPSRALLITDYRKNCWLGTPLSQAGCILEFTTDQLAADGHEVFYLPQRRSWAPPPISCREIEYPFRELPRYLAEPDFAEIRDHPLLALPGKEDYRKWTPDRHRAPTPRT